MGQAQSTNEMTGSQIHQISNKLRPKLELANQMGQNHLNAKYLSTNFFNKPCTLMKSNTKGKLRIYIVRGAKGLTRYHLMKTTYYIDDRLVTLKISQAPIKKSLH